MVIRAGTSTSGQCDFLATAKALFVHLILRLSLRLILVKFPKRRGSGSTGNHVSNILATVALPPAKAF